MGERVARAAEGEAAAVGEAGPLDPGRRAGDRDRGEAANLVAGQTLAALTAIAVIIINRVDRNNKALILNNLNNDVM